MTAVEYEGYIMLLKMGNFQKDTANIKVGPTRIHNNLLCQHFIKFPTRVNM